MIAGHDIGAAPKAMWGDSDYEYWHTFDADQERLLESRLRDRLASFELSEGKSRGGMVGGADQCWQVRPF